MALLYISLVCFAYYLAMVCVMERDLPNSISEGYYILLKRGKMMAALFCLFMFAIGLPFMIYGLMVYGDYPDTFLIFFSGAGLCFVGVASQFKEKFVGQIHAVSALVCGLAITLWTILHGDVLLLFILLGIFGTTCLVDLKNKRYILYFELFAFINAYLQFILDAYKN